MLLIGIFLTGKALLRKLVFRCPICKGRLTKPLRTDIGWRRKCPNPECIMGEVVYIDPMPLTTKN